MLSDFEGCVLASLSCRTTQSIIHRNLNHRPVRAFLITRTVGGGVDTTPPAVSKLRVVELRGKDQWLGLDEYSRLLVCFLTLGQYLTQLWPLADPGGGGI